MNLARAWLSECLPGELCHTPREEPAEQLPSDTSLMDENEDDDRDDLFGKQLTLPIERPSRLLDLMLDSGNTKFARLVEYHDGCTEYATLSYVWGPGPHLWRTTRDNVKQRMILFERTDLPPTLADAISIAERLELRYIWIDALCIVQDDLLEWTKEGSKMAGIYHGSYITIAASSSHSSRDGIFNHSSWSRLKYAESVQTNNVLMNGEQSQLHFTRYGTSSSRLQYDIERGPLAKRAWTLQERYLSPRILHFTKSQLIWECDHIIQSEDNLSRDLLGKSLPLGLPGTWTRTNLMTFWHQDLLNNYCKRRLSHNSDKLVAISALAKAIHSLCNDEYLAGLWKESLIEGLLWLRSGQGTKARRPSWSWSSQDSSIHYPNYFIMNDFDCQVQDVLITKDPLNPMGSVMYGSISLSCRICDCQLLPVRTNCFSAFLRTGCQSRTHEVLVWDGFKPMEAAAVMDNEDHPPSSGFLLYFGRMPIFLILAAVDLRTNTYERVGSVADDTFIEARPHEDLQDVMSERPKQIITIV